MEGKMKFKNWKDYVFIIPAIIYISILIFNPPILFPLIDIILLFCLLAIFYFYPSIDFLAAIFVFSIFVELGGGVNFAGYYLYIPLVSIYTFRNKRVLPYFFIPLLSLIRHQSLVAPTVLFGSILPIYYIFNSIEKKRKSLERFVLETQGLPDSVTDMDGKQLRSSIEEGIKIPKKLFDRYSEAVGSILDLAFLILKPFTVALFIKNIYTGLFELKKARSKIDLLPNATIEKGPLLYFMKEKKMLSISDYTDNSKLLCYYDKNVFIRSLVAVPVIIDNKVEGIFVVDSRIENYFDELRKEIVQGFAKEVTIMLSFYSFTNRSMIEAIHFRTIHELTQKIANTIEREDMIDAFFSSIKKTFSDVFSIIIYRTSRDFLVIEENERRYLKNIRESIVATAIEKGITLKKDNLAKEMRRPLLAPDERKFNAASLIFSPFRGKVDGGILLISGRPNRFSEKEVVIVDLISDIVSTAFEKSLLYEKERKRAIMDGLTGLYNHRFFQELLSKEISQAKRENKPLSLLMIDIDHFKNFNDEYGHQIGDRVLSDIGKIISNSIRSSDIAARYGGEEFVVILPSTTLKGSIPVAEKLRSSVESHKLLPGKHNVVNITISIGISSFPEKAEAKDELIASADAALYKAKGEGRNKISY